MCNLYLYHSIEAQSKTRLCGPGVDKCAFLAKKAVMQSRVLLNVKYARQSAFVVVGEMNELLGTFEGKVVPLSIVLSGDAAGRYLQTSGDILGIQTRRVHHKLGEQSDPLT